MTVSNCNVSQAMLLGLSMGKKRPLSFFLAGLVKAKRTKPREHLIRWRVSLIKGRPAKFIDFAYAPDRLSATPDSCLRQQF